MERLATITLLLQDYYLAYYHVIAEVECKTLPYFCVQALEIWSQLLKGV